MKELDSLPKIVLGICGTSHAEFTLNFLTTLRSLENVDIELLCTESSKKFFNQPQIEEVLKRPVLCGFYDASNRFTVPHVQIAQWADIIMLYPASANTLAKWVHGMADNLLTTTLLAHKKSVIFGPTMNEAMFENPLTQRNIQMLTDLGHEMIPRVETQVFVHSENTHVKKLFCSHESALNTLRKRIKKL